MKRILLFLFICLIQSNTFSQEKEVASVEKSIFGIQTGLLGLWVHNEARLSNQFVLRSEIGLDAGFRANSNNILVGLIPTLKLEPRWYYNLDKRLAKGKNISKNSGNSLSLNVVYNPDLFVISNEKNSNVISTIAFIPKWGIKRTYSKHFTFETGIGVGYGFYSQKYTKESGDVALDLHLRFGYTF
ncbi:MAG: hypothetical protein ACJAQ1_000785 [Flavobacterium sp.]|jgi:hypothetical protein